VECTCIGRLIQSSLEYTVSILRLVAQSSRYAGQVLCVTISDYYLYCVPDNAEQLGRQTERGAKAKGAPLYTGYLSSKLQVVDVSTNGVSVIMATPFLID
jgi:hypothetical protein